MMEDTYEDGILRGVVKTIPRSLQFLKGAAEVGAGIFSGDAAKELRSLRKPSVGELKTREELSSFLNQVDKVSNKGTTIGGLQQMAVGIGGKTERKSRPLFAELAKKSQQLNCFGTACVIEQSERARGNDTLVVNGEFGETGHALTVAGSDKEGWQVLDPTLLSHIQASKDLADDENIQFEFDANKEMQKLTFAPMSKEDLKSKLVKEGINITGFDSFKVYD